MFCLHCGGEIADDSVFCEHCGKTVVRPQEKPKSRKWLWITIIVLIFAVVAGGVVYYLSQDKSAVKEGKGEVAEIQENVVAAETNISQEVGQIVAEETPAEEVVVTQEEELIPAEEEAEPIVVAEENVPVVIEIPQEAEEVIEKIEQPKQEDRSDNAIITETSPKPKPKDPVISEDPSTSLNSFEVERKKSQEQFEAQRKAAQEQFDAQQKAAQKQFEANKEANRKQFEDNKRR